MFDAFHAGRQLVEGDLLADVGFIGLKDIPPHLQVEKLAPVERVWLVKRDFTEEDVKGVAAGNPLPKLWDVRLVGNWPDNQSA